MFENNMKKLLSYSFYLDLLLKKAFVIFIYKIKLVVSKLL